MAKFGYSIAQIFKKCSQIQSDIVVDKGGWL